MPALGARPGRTGSRDISPGQVSRKIKQDYTHGRMEPWMRGLDSIHSIIKQLMTDEPDLNELMKAAARSIYSQFNIREVTIALRSPSGVFRYVAMHGLRSELWAAHQKLAYTKEQVLDPNVYKWTDISSYTKLFLAEDNPYGEEEERTYCEHLMMRSKRSAEDESIEGDYLDIFIYGPRDETLGWIEISGTWNGKIPDVRTIRSLELLSSFLALAIVRHPPGRDKGDTTPHSNGTNGTHRMPVPSTARQP